MTSPTLGLRGESLDGWMAPVAEALGVTFEGRYSDERGGGYWRYRDEERVVLLVRNFRDEEGELLVDDRPEITVVVETHGLDEGQIRLLLDLGAEVVADQLSSWDGTR